MENAKSVMSETWLLENRLKQQADKIPVLTQEVSQLCTKLQQCERTKDPACERSSKKACVDPRASADSGSQQ